MLKRILQARRVLLWSCRSIRRDMANLLMAVVADPEEATRRPVEFLGAILQSTFLYTPIPTSHTFEDLGSTGNMRLIRNPEDQGPVARLLWLRCKSATVPGDLVRERTPPSQTRRRNHESSSKTLYHPGHVGCIFLGPRILRRSGRPR